MNRVTKSDPILRVTNLYKTFDNTIAVDGISFHLARGEVLGLLGANGAGKSTTLQILLGLTTPTSGQVHIFDRDLSHHRISILQHCNFASAYTGLPTNLKVWENLLIFAYLYQVPHPFKKIHSLLQLLQIEHLKNQVTWHLSSGESTRVHLAKALLNDPELLLLDEPTASLDPDIADKMRKFLRHIQQERGMSMIYTSHNMRDVEEVCDRVLFMHRGRILVSGTPAAIADHFQSASLEDAFIRVAREGDQFLSP